MTENNGATTFPPSIPKSLTANLLIPHPKAQRTAPSKAWVKKIVANFQPAAIGTLRVSEQSSGKLYVLDGIGRLEAIKESGHGEEKIKCEVWTGLTLAQEAELFVLSNTARTVGMFDKWDKGRMHGSQDCIGVQRICKKHGWRIVRNGSADGSVKCVKALLSVWDFDGNGSILDLAIQCLTRAYAHDVWALNGALIGGVARFLRDAPGVPTEELASKLSASYPSATRLLLAAKARAESDRGSLASNVATLAERTLKARKRRVV